MDYLIDALTFMTFGCVFAVIVLIVLVLLDPDILEHIKDDWRNS